MEELLLIIGGISVAALIIRAFIHIIAAIVAVAAAIGAIAFLLIRIIAFLA